MDTNPITWQSVFDWITGHWAFCAFFIGMIFELPKFKFKPFSRILHWIGKIVNADVYKRLDKIDKDMAAIKTDVEAVKKDNEEQLVLINKNDADVSRTTILNFANSLKNGVQHSKEEYDHVIALHDRYQEYVIKYHVTNGVLEKSYDHILKKYGECMEHNSFLS